MSSLILGIYGRTLDSAHPHMVLWGVFGVGRRDLKSRIAFNVQRSKFKVDGKGVSLDWS